MNLLQDLVQMKADDLRREGASFDETLLNKDHVSFLSACLEFQGRRISARRRTVHLSKQLAATMKVSPYATAVQDILQVARLGGDLRPYQTTRLYSFERNDLLLSDWGMHHLHLGSLHQGKRFCERTGDLLYAVFSEKEAFFIQIMDHSSFSEVELLRILDENWPTYVDPFVNSNVVAVDPELTSEEIGELRKAGVVCLVQLRRGRVLAPLGGGVSTARTSVRCMMQAQGIARILRAVEEHVSSREFEIRERLRIGAAIPLRLHALLPGAVQIIGEGKPGLIYNVPFSQ